MATHTQLQPPLKYERYYKDTTWMALPLLCLPCYFFGLRPALLCAVAIALANMCDHFIARMRKRPYNPDDYSSESFAALLALLMPATIPWNILVVAVLACVLIGKEAFGGYGSYLFHPTAVGYAVVAISWPEVVFRYPKPFTEIPLWDVSEVAVFGSMSNVLKNGGLPIVSTAELLLGDYAGALGVTSSLIVATCALFLWVRRDINIVTVASFLGACALIAFFFPRQTGLDGAIAETMRLRLEVVKYEMLSGAMLFGAVLLICEPFLCPKHWVARLCYGGVLGTMMMMFRYYGVYETGVCFALLLMSPVAVWLERITAHGVFHPLARATVALYKKVVANIIEMHNQQIKDVEAMAHPNHVKAVAQTAQEPEIQTTPPDTDAVEVVASEQIVVDDTLEQADQSEKGANVDGQST